MTPLFGRRRQSGLALNYIVLITLAFVAIAPVFILIFNAFKTNLEIGSNSLGLPTALHWENFREAWIQGNFATTTRNSLFLVVSTVALILVLGGMAAYSLARLNPPGADGYSVYMLALSAVPVWLYVVPLFVLLKRIGLMDTLWALVIAYVAFNSPFSIFLLRSFMVQVPRDFDDAARVDGANDWQVLMHVLLPNVWPGFLTVGLVVALAVWNEFQLAYIFVHSDQRLPVATSYYAFQLRFGRDWALTSAAAVMMIAPVIVFFLALQRQFIQGLTQGGLKG